MSSIRSKILTSLLAITLTAGAAFAQGAAKTQFRGGEPGQHILNFYTDYLDLTDAQQTQIKAILTQEKPIIAPMVQQLAQTHQQLRQLEESSAFDEAKVRSVAAQQSQTMVDLIVEKARAKSQMMQVLTADQKTKLQKLESRREQRMMQHLEGSAPESE